MANNDSTIGVFYGTHTGPQDVPVKSYKTRKNLEKALTDFGFNTHKHFVVCTLDGRFTAIFPQSNFNNIGGYVGLYSQHGFMTIG